MTLFGHAHLLVTHGIHIIENLNLEELAAERDLRVRLRRYPAEIPRRHRLADPTDRAGGLSPRQFMLQAPGPRGSPHDPQALDRPIRRTISPACSTARRRPTSASAVRRPCTTGRTATGSRGSGTRTDDRSRGIRIQKEAWGILAPLPSIVAAVMPAPRVPVELREFPEPVLEPRFCSAADALLRSLRHRRAPLARTPRRRAVSDHPRPRLGRASPTRFAARCAASTATAIGEGDRAGVLRRAPHLRPLPRLHGHADADALRGAPRLRHHRFGRRRPVRRLGRGDLPRARRRRWRGCPTSVPAETYISGGCGLITAVHAIDRAAMTLGDTVLVQGTGAVGLSAIALARLAGATTRHRVRRAGRSPRAGRRDGRRSRRRRARTPRAAERDAHACAT